MDAPPSAVVRQQREHGSLRERATRLKEAAKADLEGGIADRLRHEFASFADALHRHFDAEETGGAFDEIVQRRPDLVDTTRRLTREHGEILAGLEGLREELDRATKDDLTSQLLGLLHRFETHEADENQLLLSAWCDDLGVGD